MSFIISSVFSIISFNPNVLTIARANKQTNNKQYFKPYTHFFFLGKTFHNTISIKATTQVRFVPLCSPITIDIARSTIPTTIRISILENVFIFEKSLERDFQSIYLFFDFIIVIIILF